jgi:transcriptional regulator
VLHELIRRYNFGTLFTHAGGESHVTHLPFLIDPERGPHGTLRAHMARANPHWKTLEGAADSLVVFLGAHSYISPGWYEERDTVPTWNYAAVHARGSARLVTNETPLRDMLEALINFHEEPLGCPWKEGASEEAMKRNLPDVVGFEIEIERLEGNFKFTQNHSDADQERVADALEDSRDPMQREVAEIMRRYLRNRGE